MSRTVSFFSLVFPFFNFFYFLPFSGRFYILSGEGDDLNKARTFTSLMQKNVSVLFQRWPDGGTISPGFFNRNTNFNAGKGGNTIKI